MSGPGPGEHMSREQLESLGYNPDAVQIILEIIAEGQQAGK